MCSAPAADKQGSQCKCKFALMQLPTCLGLAAAARWPPPSALMAAAALQLQGRRWTPWAPSCLSSWEGQQFLAPGVGQLCSRPTQVCCPAATLLSSWWCKGKASCSNRNLTCRCVLATACGSSVMCRVKMWRILQRTLEFAHRTSTSHITSTIKTWHWSSLVTFQMESVESNPATNSR